MKEPTAIAFIHSLAGLFPNMLLNIFLTFLISFFVFTGTASAATPEELYGFTPASETVHNYTVTDGTTSVQLLDFTGHEKPLPEGYRTDEQYQIALDAWNLEDGGKWARLWPYVPMFSREDVKGFVQAIDEPFQNTNPNPIEVAIPHLARTYEVASALSYILSPYSTDRSYSEPNLSSQWINPAPWENDAWWLGSDESQPGNWDELGPVCDPQQWQISSSGDNAYDSQSNTAVLKTITIDTPPSLREQPLSTPEDCGLKSRQYPCEKCTDSGNVDDSDCFVDQAVRFSPTYFKTFTPFLHAITDRLLTGKNAVFNIFKPFAEVANEDIENWPGVGGEGEPSLAYNFSGGQAEAGNKQDASQAKYYFKYLGTLHCQKERLVAKLQPFLGGVAEIDPQCTGGAPATPTGGQGQPIAGQGCFVFDVGAKDPSKFSRPSVPWETDPAGKANVEMAISLVLKSPTWANLVCGRGPVRLYRVAAIAGGGWARSDQGQIFLYNGGVSNPGTAIYTLAHETGHIVSTRNPTLFTQFMSQGVISRDGGYLRTYPNDKTDFEDFAETAGLYVGVKYYCNPRWCGINYPREYPAHYNFAKEVMFGGLEY